MGIREWKRPVLQRFLNNGLIDVGGDDAKLEKLSHAAKDLAGILRKKLSKALNYLLIAFDPRGSGGRPRRAGGARRTPDPLGHLP